jgi:transposase-like protein
MARRYQFTMSESQRRKRFFSEEFKRRKVEELEQKLVKISEICREYEVSDTAVYEWINKYSRMKQKKERMVLESDSDTRKLHAMKERIKELERIIGRKQLLIDFQSKVIELAEEEYKIDIKKKFGEAPYSGTGITGKNTE